MDPSPPSGTLLLQSAPAEAWQVWGALAPVFAAVVAGLIAAAALWQKRRADNRAEWWNRTQWALDASLSKEPKRAEMGLKMVDLQAHSRLATEEELVLLDVAWKQPVREAEGTRGSETALAPRSPEQVTQDRRGVHAAAARLRVTLDTRLGRDTPGWVKELASKDPA
ncbi:hypothetical protein [Pseudarthrobacter sp. N5]|uniref:hypothetical protein n=1 Tax=Pseudarthrobacter sp. N5 TaxID=3418416 RepID=UPI003CE76D9D